MRRLASLIDGRLSIAWEIDTNPPLSVSTKVACVRQGLKFADRLIAEEVRAMAEERVLRASCPELFVDELECIRG